MLLYLREYLLCIMQNVTIVQVGKLTDHRGANKCGCEAGSNVPTNPKP